jgi:hypothetical protein
VGVDGVVAGLAKHDALSLARRPHVAGQPGVFHLSDPSDVVDLAGLIGVTAALALTGVEAFHHLGPAEHELRRRRRIEAAPRPHVATEVFQLPDFDRPGFISNLEADVKIRANAHAGGDLRNR